MGEQRQAGTISAFEIDIISKALRWLVRKDRPSAAQSRQHAVDLIRELTGCDSADEDVVNRIVKAAEGARIRQLHPDYASVNTEQLSLLQGIFEEVCATLSGISEAEREAIARKMLVLFKGGTRDRQLLKIVLTQAAGRLRRSG